ncbi:MAG: LamG-like jellyroll fold domain-containing protein [Nostoc sp.]|uniref:LamG-like jellyroll fold domain-containing protein n=1 Tax=Nostoc sp. TaxID=1180 RepID=UPI002FF8B131
MPLYKEQNASGLVLPVETRTTATDSDYVFMIDVATNTPYRITKADLLAGLSNNGGSPGSGNGSSGGTNTNTLLLLHGNASDSSSYGRTPSTNTASISTDIKKFNSSSLRFDGNNELVLSSTDFNIGAGDCTAEFFLYTANISSGQNIIDFRPPSTNGNYPVVYVLNNVLSLQFGNTTVNGNISPIASSWNYIALKKSGINTSLWLNGVNIGSANTGDWASSGNVIIGNGAFGTGLNGHLDEIRISKTALNVSTVPTSAFTS